MRWAWGPSDRGVSGAAAVAPLLLLGLCVVVLVVVLVLLWAMLLLASGFHQQFRIGLGFGDRFGMEEDLVPEVCGEQCREGVVPGLLPWCWGCPCGGQEASGCLDCRCCSGFGRGLVDQVGAE